MKRKAPSLFLSKTKSMLRPILSPVIRWIRKTSFFKNRVIPWILRGEIGLLPDNAEMERIRSHLKEMAMSGKTIIVGPWLSELGFETLYWIPFLRWFKETYNVSSDRLIVVSRGGMNQWYSDITDTYIDIFDYFTETQFREKNIQRKKTSGIQKQVSVCDFDKELIKKIRKKYNISEFDWLHPHYMNRFFKMCWNGRFPASFVSKHASFRKLDIKLDESIIKKFPSEYVAVKFYFNDPFPETECNKQIVRGIIESLSSKTPVVLLHSDFELDDHSDCGFSHSENIYPIKNLVNLRDNIHLQTQIVSNAKAFYGTYGGFSHVGLFCNVPTISIFSNEECFSVFHLDIVRRVSRLFNYGFFDKLHKKKTFLDGKNANFVALNVNNIDLLKNIFKCEKYDDTYV